MKRRSGTLYELGRDRLSRLDTSVPTPQPVASEPKGPSSGSSAKLPVGLLAIGGAAVVVLVVLVWWLGFSSVADRGDGGAIEAAGNVQPPGHVIDPLVHSIKVDPVVAPERVPSEPRADGRWYFVLAETRPEGARRLAAFCRAQGLDAAVISGHNTRLERVIALPGLDSASTTTDAYIALDDRIRDVGRRWKASGGTTNLSDRYLDRKKTSKKTTP